ncbi:MAG: Ig-like domain-containing protein [Ruminococcus sp.]|nr:Ig-like domain-containing protein [Ruminococcus sp.]
MKRKTFKLKAKAVAQSKKPTVKKHRVIKYESSNKKIATVNSKGKITAKKKEICYICAYAQSGAFKRIKVTVK